MTTQITTPTVHSPRPTCISYIRFSTEKQAHGSSLERQLEKTRLYAAERGYDLDESLSFRDLGVSAYTGDHAKFGALHRFLEAIESGRIAKGTILLVESLDRLSRESVPEALSQFMAILNKGITVVTLTDKMEYTKENYNSDYSKLLISLNIMMRANEESRLKSERIRHGFDLKRQKLATEKMTSKVPMWLKLNKDKDKFELVTEHVEVVKRIFQLSFDGNGIITIAGLLTKAKIKTFKKLDVWCPSTVRKILSSRSVIGEFQPHIFRNGMKKPEPIGDVVIDYFPKIIDSDLYSAVQERLANGTHIAGRTATVENIFGGITYCGYCGSRMDVVKYYKAKKDTRSLTCSKAKKGAGCSYISFRCGELENAFFEFCRDRAIIDVLNIEGNRDKEIKHDLLGQWSVKQGELSKIQKSIDTTDMDRLAAEDDLMRAHFNKKLKEYVHAQAILQTDIHDLSLNITSIDMELSDVETRVSNLLDIIDNIKNTATNEEQVAFRIMLRNNLRQIVKKVIVFPKGRLATDEQIEGVGLNETRNMLRSDTDSSPKYERTKLKKAKEKRFFEIHFKNGNFRRIIFDKELGSYIVTLNRSGNMLEWKTRGKQMQPIINPDINDEILAYKKAHPDLTSEAQAAMLREMHETYSPVTARIPESTPKNRRLSKRVKA